MSKKMKLAEALVMRKHLMAKVDQLKPLYMQGEKGLFETKTERRAVNENTEEVVTLIPKITLADVTKEYDKYSKALRLLDTEIQRVNWTTDIDFDDTDLAV